MSDSPLARPVPSPNPTSETAIPSKPRRLNLTAPGWLSYDEQPAHPVSIDAFAMMAAPVSQSDFAKSGLPGSADNVSHATAVLYAEFFGKLPPNAAAGGAFRLPLEAEWEHVKKAGLPGFHFTGLEHVFDWHGVYDAERGASTAGPSTGVLKVVRDGASAVPTTRYTVAVAGGHNYPAVGFRLVRVAVPWAPRFAPPSLSQIAVVPTGKVVVTTGDGRGRTIDVAKLGPASDSPLFNVRMVMPIPPDSEKDGVATLTGLNPATMFHNHSPGFEILENGDVLAVWFSSAGGGQEGPTPGEGGKESSINTRMVQARLRHGSDRWDPPSLFYDFKYSNDQSALLWSEGGRTWFWGGGGKQVPFKVAVTDDSGATWKLHLPDVTNVVGPTELASQPITTAFRDGEGRLYMGVDSAGASSGLWRSPDDGKTWADTHGRTVGRHTTFFTANASASTSSTTATGSKTIFAYGGKNSNIDGYMPYTYSTDDGATFAEGAKLPFPALGGNQRPCVHRLNSGNLVFVGDLQVKGTGKQPAGWKGGTGVYAALSKDDGKTWKIRPLPISLPHETDQLAFGTLGYSTVRQGPNGVIHILSTMTHPCLHYEINEAWLESDLPGLPASATASTAVDPPQRVSLASVTVLGGKIEWGAEVGGAAGYALDGDFVTYHPDNTTVEYNATHAAGVMLSESLFDASGRPVWRWNHGGNSGSGGDNVSVFERFFADGGVLSRASFDNKPVARDAHLIKTNPPGYRFIGLTAEGPACIFAQNGTVRSAVTFRAGLVDNTTRTQC